MAKPPFIDCIRSDMSDWLVHCVKSTDNVSAFNTLKKILEEKCLRGSKDRIRAGCNCVCFSETPLTKIMSLAKFCEKYPNTRELVFSSFGIAVKKEWLFERQGRPVIYQSDPEFCSMPSELQFRHVRYEPNSTFESIDFTWEREWRIKTEKLELDPKKTTVFVRNRKNLENLLMEHYDIQNQGAKYNNDFNVEIYPWGLIALNTIS